MTNAEEAQHLEQSVRRSHRWSAGAVWILALAVPLILWALGASRQLLWLGAASWLAAVLIKIPISIAIAIVAKSWSPRSRAVVQGALSAAIELGGAAFLLLRVPGISGWLDVFAFACGAGSLEAVVLLVVSAVRPASQSDMERWAESAQLSPVVRHVFALERALAWFGHLGSRSLLAIGVLQANPLPIVVAFATFAATDGTAGYLTEQGADWFDPAALTRYFKLAAWLVAVELVVLAVFLAISAI